MSIRSLSSELRKKATEELYEIPEEVEEHLRYIRNWLTSQPHLHARNEDQWLLTFLRGCKYSYGQTKSNIDYFYTMKSMVPEFFANRDPFSSEIQEILKASIFMVLPKAIGPSGPRILICRLNEYDADKINMQNLLKVYFMCLDILMYEDDTSVISGILEIADLKNISVKTVMQCTPTLLKKLALCLQGKYPLRFKGCHYINAPSIFETVFNTSKSFMNDKLKERISMQSESNFENIYRVVPKSLLPTEYGGEAGSTFELAGKWSKKIESYRDWFLEDSQYRSDENLRPVAAKTYEELFGTEGSFKKLNID